MSLDETQIRRRPPDEPSPEAAPEPSLAPLKTAVELAYQRAPTLMGGASAGSQGQVRVWSPSRKLLWGLVAWLGAANAVLLLVALLRPEGSRFPSLFYLFWGLVVFFQPVRALRRPGYITTDDAGMGITTRKGSLTLRWTEIKAIRSTQGSNHVTILAPNRMDLNTQGKLEISLTGYPTELRRELLALMSYRAGLEASGSHVPPHLFIRPGYTVFNNWCEPVTALKGKSEDCESADHADSSFTDA